MKSSQREFDWKLLGYGVSSISVAMLGAAAWPGADHRWWHLPLLAGGMLFSVLGMAARYISHRIDRQKIETAAEGNGTA